MILTMLGAIIYGWLLYFLVNLMPYSNSVKAFLCLAITLVLLLLLKLLNSNSKESEEDED